MIRKYVSLALALSLAMLAGCIETRDEYTLNPDGSGKIKVSRKEPASMTLMGGGKDFNPEAELLKVAKNLIEKSKGVEAWKDVTWKVADDGRIHVTGTAYFKDINALTFSSKEGRVRLVKLEGGKLALLLGKQPGAKPKTEPGVEPKKLSEEELKRKILIEKMKWRQGRGMLVATLSGMVMESTYNLPGKVEKTSCFKKLAEQKVRFTIKGDDFIKILDQLTADAKFWQAQATGANRGSLKNMEVPEALEKLYGSKEPPRVEFSAGDAPLFDYAKEVAEAKKTMPELIKKLGAKTSTGSGSTASDPGKKPEPVAEPAKAGAALGKLLVTQIKQIRKPELPADAGMYFETPSCQVTFVAKLPGKVLKVEDGAIEKIVAEDDSDLMPESKYSRKTSGAYLQGKKKDYVQFTVRSKPLPADGKTIKLISGHLVYTVGSGSKKVDVGEMETKKDATAKELSAKITRFDKRFRSLTLELALKDPSMVRAVKLTTVDGKALETTRNYANTWSGKSRISLRIPADIPDKVKVEVELYEKTEKRNMPFKIENLKVR